jgi:hypothetical protein
MGVGPDLQPRSEGSNQLELCVTVVSISPRIARVGSCSMGSSHGGMEAPSLSATRVVGPLS